MPQMPLLGLGDYGRLSHPAHAGVAAVVKDGMTQRGHGRMGSLRDSGDAHEM